MAEKKEKKKMKTVHAELVPKASRNVGQADLPTDFVKMFTPVIEMLV